MRIKDIKIPVVVISFLLTLGILFAGMWLYKDLYVNDPLAEKLQKIPAVKEYELIIDEKSLEVTLGTVDNLKETYLEIENSIKDITNDSGAFEIKIKDNPDNLLNSVWEKAQFAVYEALEQGNFNDMAVQIKKVIEEFGLEKYKIQMDKNNIYIQLHHGDKFLYKVLQR
jgi:hypothetical protein